MPRYVVFGTFQLCETDVLLPKFVVVPVLPLQLFVDGDTVLPFHPDVTALPDVAMLPVL